MKFSVQIPAKLMLAGEYSVLWGGRSLSFALDKFMKIQFDIQTNSLNKQSSVNLSSQLWADETVQVLIDKRGELSVQSRDQQLENSLFVRSVFQIFRLLLSSHPFFFQEERFDAFIHVDSELDPRYGLGSSSALCLGLFTVWAVLEKRLTCWSKGKMLDGSKVVFTKEEDAPRILEQAYAMQKSMQGQASGYDLLTQCYGGLLLYQADLMTWPGAWHQQNEFESQLLSFVHIFVGGKGAPTTELLKDTVPWLAKKQGELIQLSNSLVDMLLHFWRSPSLESKKNFFTQLQAWRVFFSSAPHYPKNLFQQLNVIPGLDHSWTYKSSGAGGEDALILFGDKQDLVFATKVLQDRGWFRLDLKLAKQGLSFASHR